MATQKSRPKNKINKQREIEQRRRKRRKTVLTLILLIIVLACIGAYLLTSPTFKIQEISIKGNEQLTTEKVEELAEIKKGDNIFSKISKVLEVKLKQKRYIKHETLNPFYKTRITANETKRKK